MNLHQILRAISKRGLIIILGMLILLVLIIILIIVLICIHETSNPYCEPGLCPDNVTHIGCRPNASEWYANCINATEITFTSEMKNAFLDKINYYRNGYAGNLMTKPIYQGVPDAQQELRFETNVVYKPTERPPCARCGLIQWDNELEYLAQLGSRSCNSPINPNCYNTTKFRNAGEILVFTEAREYIFWLESVVDQWAYTEDYYHISDEHYMVIDEKQTHVGCGLVSLDVDESDSKEIRHLYMVCYFANANLQPKTVEGSNFVGRGGSKCTTGVDFKYKYLCSLDEDITADKDVRQVSFVDVKDEDKPIGAMYVVTGAM